MRAESKKVTSRSAFENHFLQDREPLDLPSWRGGGGLEEGGSEEAWEEQGSQVKGG